ncbi:MAG TPA: hypothetical protein VGN44_13850 [Candidatus Angelobacter sp.]|jgi:hypothetical protein
MKTLPAGMPLAIFENNPNACYTLGADLEITYCNRAWDCFAAENNGHGLLAESVLHRPVLEFFTPVMRDYYAEIFIRARQTLEIQCQEYECSSPEIFRFFRMQIYPLKNGFAVINSLHVKKAHAQPGLQPLDARYLQSNAFLRICSNCRRTCRNDESGQWDWVPEYLQPNRKNVTHGICAACLEYFYRMD